MEPNPLAVTRVEPATMLKTSFLAHVGRRVNLGNPVTSN